MNKTIETPVPTNIITGFLGVGKTTLIQHLLTQKPEQERWAVLVNEFGEVGIDGAFFSSHPQQGIYVREVPGGCMCCTSGLPMQIALNQLLAMAKPHRLLIEPTGLGHPKEVLETLVAPHYRQVLELRSTITLVDARKLKHARYRDHSTFKEQLQIADHIIAAKSDLYQNDDLDTLATYLRTLGIESVPVTASRHGALQLDILVLPSRYSAQPQLHQHHSHGADVTDYSETLRKEGRVCVSNQGDGFHSKGWIFSPEHCFDYRDVCKVLTGIDAERLKAVFITEQGIFAFNLADGALTQFELDEADDSRLEFITSDAEQAEHLAGFS